MRHPNAYRSLSPPQGCWRSETCRQRGQLMSSRSAKPTRPYARHDRKANSPPQGESFGWLTLSMMKSAAYRALSPAARKVLDRIHVEHLEHGGRENGSLKVTHRDLRKAGVQQRRITGAIAEVEALGWAIRT